jgi:putative ABC transport system substrate-binding protein
MIRILFSLLLISLLLPISQCIAANTPKRIIIMETMPVPVVLEHSHWFKQEMQRLGYVPGKNAVFEVIKAQGDKQRAITQLKGAMKHGKPDVVVTFATLASQAAHEVLAGKKVPIVFAVVSDPVGAGLIKRLRVPSKSNITGLVFTLFRKVKVDMAMRLLAPGTNAGPLRFGVIHSSYPAARGDVEHYKKIAKAKPGLEFINYEIPYQKMPQGLDAMMDGYQKGINRLKGRVDYWWQVSGPLGEVEESTAMLLKAEPVPLIYGNTIESVKAGALFSINANYIEGGKETARLVDAVLNGADPGSIPVVPPDNFDLGINLTTAMKLKIVIPSDLLTMAGERVFR